MTAAEDLAFAHDLADLARPLALRWFRTALAVERKADDSPVTVADREVERALRERIAARFPHDGVLGEEHGRERADGDRVWVLDPIDGTKSYVTASPLFGTLIALAERRRPTVGVIDLPALGERYSGAAGGATTSDGTPLRVSSCTEIADARLALPGPLPGDLAERAGLVRYGGDCFMYCQLALGGVDLVVEPQLEPYDVAALVPVVEGAGGVISDWSGDPVGIASAGSVVAAATAELHEAALAILAG